jgi:hypothetical protein
MTRTTRVVALGLVLTATACLSQNAAIPQSNVIEADEKMVADCQFPGNVQGVAMWANGSFWAIPRSPDAPARFPGAAIAAPRRPRPDPQ